MLRIAFVGLPLAALLLHQDGHDIVYAGVCRKGALGTRRLRQRIGADRVRIVPDLTRDLANVKASKPDLLVSWFWTTKVPRSVRNLAPLGSVGVHPSLLPRHRGPDPYYWAIARGDEVTGVSAHALEDEYDTGHVFATRELRIDPSWNAWTLAKKLDRPSLALLRETVARFAHGPMPVPTAQDERAATDAPAPSESDLELRWYASSREIEQRVRAAAPWPGAFTALGEHTLVLTRVATTLDFPAVLVPGEAAVRNDGVTIVRTGDGAVEIREARLEGEEDDDKTLLFHELAEIVRATTTLATLS